MTDRIHSITLVLDKDIRIDDAEMLIQAAGMFKGVINVQPNVSDYDSIVAIARVKSELTLKLFEALKEK